MKPNTMTLRLQRERIPMKEFGLMLFGHLYAEASAYLVTYEENWELKLFDTTCASEVLDRDWPAEATITLFSNHPEGNLEPTITDLRNLEFLPGAALYIVCEDECRQVA